MIKLLFHPVSASILLIVASLASFRLGTSRSTETIVEKIDTIRVARQITKRDTINVYRPFQVVRYDTVRVVDTKLDTIRVPVNFGYTGVIGANPVTLDRKGFTVTSFDLESQRFQQSRYKFPVRKWGFGVYAFSGVYTQYSAIGVEMDVRYQNITLTPRLGVIGGLRANPGLFYGAQLRYKLF